MNELNHDVTSAPAAKAIHQQPGANPSAASQSQPYQAANFEDQAFALFDPASIASKSQSATEETAANQAIKSLAIALINSIDKRDAEIDENAQAEERSVMDDFAKQRGYVNWKAMSDKHNAPAKSSDSNVPGMKQSPPVDNAGKSATAIKPRNVSSKKPFDFLLKDAYTSDGQPDFDLGHYNRFGIKSGCKMAKAFETKHGIELTRDHFRAATQQERDAMKTINDAEFDNIKRRAPRAKKP